MIETPEQRRERLDLRKLLLARTRQIEDEYTELAWLNSMQRQIEARNPAMRLFREPPRPAAI